MSGRQVRAIAFPEDTVIRQSRRSRTLIYLSKLLYGSGIFLTSVYALVILVVIPLLDLQVERRLELVTMVKQRLSKEVYTKIARRLKDVPNVLINYAGKVYSDASVQTDSFGDEKSSSYFNKPVVRFEAKLQNELELLNLNDRLIKLRESVLRLSLSDYDTDENKKINDENDAQNENNDTYKITTISSEMKPLNFQLKQLQTYMALLSESIFRRDIKKGGYEFFDRGKTTRRQDSQSKNIMVDLRREIKEVRTHALKNY